MLHGNDAWYKSEYDDESKNSWLEQYVKTATLRQISPDFIGNVSCDWNLPFDHERSELGASRAFYAQNGCFRNRCEDELNE